MAEEINKETNTAEYTENSVKNFFEKVLPVISAIQKNSEYIASKRAISFIETENEEDKNIAKVWIQRNKNFKSSLALLLNDPLVPNDLKETYKIEE